MSLKKKGGGGGGEKKKKVVLCKEGNDISSIARDSREGLEAWGVPRAWVGPIIRHRFVYSLMVEFAEHRHSRVLGRSKRSEICQDGDESHRHQSDCVDRVHLLFWKVFFFSNQFLLSVVLFIICRFPFFISYFGSYGCLYCFVIFDVIDQASLAQLCSNR